MHQIIWREGWVEAQLKNCASNKFPSEVVAAGPGPESENHWSRDVQSCEWKIPLLESATFLNIDPREVVGLS